MPEQKIDNLLNLAMDAMPREREKSGNLNVGYQAETRLWEVIVKYSGQEEGLSGEGISVVPLLGGYAVVTIPETEIDAFPEGLRWNLWKNRKGFILPQLRENEQAVFPLYRLAERG